MPQSLSKICLHFIFSVKNREKLIKKSCQKDLHAYIIGIFSNYGSYTEAIYAVSDHIHILCTLPRTISVSDLMSKVKSSSSKFMKQSGINNFAWQNGYAVFSVSSSKVETVKTYILNQEKHHQKSTFQDEYRTFLKEYNIEYNEQYVWD